MTGYRILSTLCETAGVGMYRAQGEGDESLLLRMSLSARPGADEIKRFDQEFETARRLDRLHVLRPIRLEHPGGVPVLVMEDWPCCCLDRIIKNRPDLGQILKIAMALAEALSHVHRQKIVHKDIRPEHVLVGEDGSVRLTGFGIAAGFSRERQAPGPPEAIAGTLAYMSPEQTGRMNRSLDSRSDLYSAGVVLYQMLTGRLPFTACDPIEWVHCHIAQQPPLPTLLMPSVPEALSVVVLKLLAKTAEDRYQTADGLKADLQWCLRGWERFGSIDAFLPGTCDVPDRVVIPEKLYGRDRESEMLREAFEQMAMSGVPEFVMISGYSGIGKSSVVHELHRMLVPLRGIFAEGKYEQSRSETPYGAMAGAMQSLVHQVLCLSETELEWWRKSIREALGSNALLMIHLVPELELIIGPQPAVPELPALDARNRFEMVLRNFIYVFARAEHPLVLFLDDLQWLDSSSLQFLEYLSNQPELQYLMFIGAYRSNEVTGDHPMMQTLDAMKSGGTRIRDIELQPLTQRNVARLIIDTFRCDGDRARPLADLILEKTGGNPFFAVQFIEMLAREGLVAYDLEGALWHWDLERILSKGFADNVADLLLDKLSRLPVTSLECLQVLASMGHSSSLRDLALVMDRTEEQVLKCLEDVLALGFIFSRQGLLTFMHDRIQEAACAIIAETERPALHLSMGRKLRDGLGQDELGARLFDVLNHLNRGSALISDAAEKEALALMNAEAGRKARASGGYRSACSYFSTAVSIAAGSCREPRHSFLFPLYLDWVECEFVQGNFAEAEELFQVLGALEQDEFDMARVCLLRMRACQAGGRYDEAVSAGLGGLSRLGVHIPDDDEQLRREIEQEAAAVSVNLGDRRIADLVDAPAAVDRRIKSIIGLLGGISPAAYSGSRPQINELVVLKTVNLSLVHGNTNESCNGYSAYAFMLVSLYGDPRRAFQFSEMSIALSEKLGDIVQKGIVLQLHGNHVNFWLHHFSTDFPVLEQGFEACLNAGDLLFANFIAFQTVWQTVERGDMLSEVLEGSRKYADFSRSSRNEAIHGIILLEQQFARCLMGQTEGCLSFSDTAVREGQCLEVITGAVFKPGLVVYHVMKLLAAFLMDDLEMSRFHAAEAGNILSAVMGMPLEATWWFLNALICARDARLMQGKTRDEKIAILKECEKKHRLWAEHCPDNFLCRHRLVAAELADLESRVLDAERLYEEALESARTHGFIHWAAMIYESEARHYGRRGLKHLSRLCVEEARYCYGMWGAESKVRRLEVSGPFMSGTRSAEKSSLADDVGKLDVMAIARAHQAISGAMKQNETAETLLRIAMENAGARKGYLWVEPDREVLASFTAGTEGETLEYHVPGQDAKTDVPRSILNYVRRTCETVLIDDGHPDIGGFASDAYLQEVRPRSLVCVPVMHRTKLVAMLYLENDLVPGAFTAERLTVIKILASQAAISLENAGIYEALQQSEKKYRRIVETSSEGILMIGADMIISFVNTRMAEMIGYACHELMGRSILDFLFPEDWPDHLKKVMERHNISEGHYERRFIHRDGRERWALLSSSAIYDEEGRYAGSFAMLTDITDRREAEAEITRLNQCLELRVAERTAQLEAAYRELETYSYSVSHDLRTPLRHINGFIELLREETEGLLSPQCQHYANTISRSALHMGNLIDGLLTFSRVGRHKMLMMKIDMGELVRETVKSFSDACAGRVIDWQTGEMPIVNGDLQLLRSVMANLISNAIKFTRNRPEARIEIGHRIDGDEHVFFVRDNGAGFNQAHSGKLFGVFQRLHREEQFEGTGIGLANVRRIIERHRGRTWAEGKPDQGASFFFTLPVG